MKSLRKIKFIIKISSALSVAGLTYSCNFLDIVPPEQANLYDATKDANNTLNFLYTCYQHVWNPLTAGPTDEHVFPAGWGGEHRSVSYGLHTPSNRMDDGRWTNFHRSINQTNLFLKELENARGVSETQAEQWKAEAYFLLAYYHYELLQYFGPIPILDQYYDTNTPPSQFSGRMHYDYVTDWIVNTLDEKVINNPYMPDTRPSDERGRATTVIAKALKARALVYAASPLWNGEFPYPNWKNTEETPGYGNELVSSNYNADKWNRAKIAAQEAIAAANTADFQLYDQINYSTEIQRITDAKLPFIPGLEDPDSEQGKEFRKRVLMLRNMMTLKPREGNTEIIWGVAKDAGVMGQILPRKIMQLNNGSFYNGQNAISPTLYSVEHFYTDKGILPEQGAENGSYFLKNEWLSRANINDRPDITKINLNREPRYYAWIAFDQGDYGTTLAAGNPKRIEMKRSDAQGYNITDGSQNYSSTGFMNQKWIRVDQSMGVNGTWSNNDVNRFMRPIIRMAELYLNLAEAQASLGEPAALETLNIVRKRAGLKALTTADLQNKSTLEWVRNERFIELWAEGHRWNDVRRWVKGAEYFSEGKREGLDAIKVNPTFETFNTRTKVDQEYRWYNRMYLAPIQYNEIQKNPKLIQAPGY